MNEELLDKRLFETALKDAVAQCVEEECAPIREKFANGAEPDYSPRFRRRMRRLLQKNKHPAREQWQKYGKRAAAVAVVLGVGFFSAMSVEAVRVRVNDFFLSITNQSTIIDFNGNNGNISDIPEGWDFVYSPGYLPKGYTLQTTDFNESNFTVVYHADNEKEIDFSQNQSFEGMLALDTEDAETEQIPIGASDGAYVEKNGSSMLFWSNNDSWFTLTTTLGREETIKIAESIKKLKK